MPAKRVYIGWSDGNYWLSDRPCGGTPTDIAYWQWYAWRLYQVIDRRVCLWLCKVDNTAYDRSNDAR